jgi:hypothetical protein
MRTLKEEEVYGRDYQDLKDARSRIGEFLEQVYNRQRLHSALRYLTPEEFEQESEARGSDGADGSGGKPKAGLPPLPQALEIPSRTSTLPSARRLLTDTMTKIDAEVSPITGAQRVSA